MLEDTVLLWKFKRGSRDALHRIYEKYRRDLLTLAINFLGDVNGAEDVVQDVFISLVQSADKIRLSGNLKGYLVTCAANKSRDIMRKRRQQRTMELPEEEAPVISDSNNPVQLLMKNEQLERLSRLLTELPELQREVMVLRLQGEMKFKAIAKFQDVSIKTAQSRYRCGLEKLRSTMTGEA